MLIRKDKDYEFETNFVDFRMTGSDDNKHVVVTCETKAEPKVWDNLSQLNVKTRRLYIYFDEFNVSVIGENFVPEVKEKNSKQNENNSKSKIKTSRKGKMSHSLTAAWHDYNVKKYGQDYALALIDYQTNRKDL